MSLPESPSIPTSSLPAPSAPSFSAPTRGFSGPVIVPGFGYGPGYGPPGYGPPGYGPYGPYGPGYAGYGYASYGPGYVGFWNWTSIFWSFFIFFIIILIVVLVGYAGTSSALTNGMSFPTTQTIQIVNQTGKVFTAVYFIDTNQTISVLSTTNGTSIPIGGSFIVPLQSGSMVWAQDGNKKTYAMIFSNINSQLQMIPFTDSTISSFFQVYPSTETSNSYRSYVLNIIPALTNKVVFPNTIPLVNNMTFPSSVTLINQSQNKKFYSVISSNNPIQNVTLNSGSSPTPTPSGQPTPSNIGQVALNGYVLYLSIIPGANNLYSGTLLFNLNGKVMIQTLFGQPSTDSILVPTGYTQPQLYLFGIEE